MFRSGGRCRSRTLSADLDHHPLPPHREQFFPFLPSSTLHPLDVVIDLGLVLPEERFDKGVVDVLTAPRLWEDEVEYKHCAERRVERDEEYDAEW